MSHSTGLSTRPVGTVRLFACGGGGINIGKDYISEGHSADIANIEVAFLDTSDSNLADRLIEHTFLFTNPNDKTDGSGKIKSANAELIIRSLPEVLRKFPAGDMNIVVYTASGGTGNVAGVSLHRMLLEAGHSVVSIVIGSAESERTAQNTIGTLTSLAHVANDLQKPVIFHFGMNSQDGSVPRSAIDKEAHLMITALAILCSRRNHGLDTADVTSFLQYNSPRPEIKPSLARIHVLDDHKLFDQQIEDPIAVAYLKRDADDPQPLSFAPYLCDGILPNIAQTSNKSLFFGIETKTLFKVHTDLETLRKELASRAKARVDGPVFGSASDKIGIGGLVMD